MKVIKYTGLYLVTKYYVNKENVNKRGNLNFTKI